MKWTSYDQTLPKRWARKADIPAMSPHIRPLKAEFRFEHAWIVRDAEGRVLMPDGQWAEALDFHLHTPGHVIGLADMASADGSPWAVEWRNAMVDKRLGR